MGQRYIRFEIKEGFAWITFNRPEKMNALNSDLLSDLETKLDECEKNDSIRVVLLRGNEKAFIAGADIEHMAKGRINLAYEMTDKTMRIQEKLADLSKPTIAVISGYALGGGCEVALCCDFRIAAENAVFGFPEIKLGIIPGGGGTQRLPRIIGLGLATELIFLGETLGADRAQSIGLIHKVVPLEQLEFEAEKLAFQLTERPPLALRAAKMAIRTGLNIGLKDGLQLEQSVFCMLFGTEDKKEGIAAFIEKRKPIFMGE